MAQCGELIIIDQNIGVARTQSCAPVNATLSADYTFQNPVDASKVQFRFFLNDDVTAPVTVNGIQDATNPNKFSASVNHLYVQGSDCDYTPEIYIVYDGVLCTGTGQSQAFHVWNTDETNPGPVVMDPEVAEFCPTTPISNFIFHDNTTFNCNKEITNTNPNRQNRWVQFIYNTDHTNGKLVQNVTVNGVQLTDAAGNFITELTGNVELVPYPADGPVSYTLGINAPAGSPVGNYFEVTMRNWNICNPYDDPNIAGPPADPSMGDNPPIETTARILIVAPPKPVITADEEACPGEEIYFDGAEAAGITGVGYEWEVYNDVDGTELLASSKDADFWFDGFATAGKKLVKLKIQRLSTQADCWSVVTDTINVYDAPTVSGKINGVDVPATELCYDPENSTQNIVYSHEMFSENSYSYSYKLFKRNSTSLTPDSIPPTVISGTRAANSSASVSYTASYSKPGKYQVWLVSVDAVTGCETIDTRTVTIYDKPVADFTFTELCEGQTSVFTDASLLSFAINGDKIVSWEWDVNYDGITFSADYSVKGPVSHTYSTADTYKVALRVKTSEGACSDIAMHEVKVYPVPVASLDYDYTAPVCPGELITFENLSPGSNTAALFPEGVNYTLVQTDGVVSEESAFPDATRAISFDNNTNTEKVYKLLLKATSVESACQSLSDTLEVRVKPGAVADFYEPDYSAFDENCSPVNLNLKVSATTLALAGESHTWVISLNGVTQDSLTYYPTEQEYSELSYPITNTTDAGLTYKVKLLVSKTGACVRPVTHSYRVNPVPAAEDFPIVERRDCEYSYFDVKAEDLAGVKNLHWTIFPLPENHATLTYDNEFTLIYKRPARNEAAEQVKISLVKENYFGCESAETLKEVDNLPKVIETVELSLLSSESEGCSPLVAQFENTTVAPAGTIYELYIRKNAGTEELANLSSAELENQFSYTFTEPASYIVRLKAIGPDGCSLYNTTPLNLVVYDDPQPNFTLNKLEGCAPLDASFIRNIQNSTSNSWLITEKASGAVVYNPAAGVDTIANFRFENATNIIKEYEVKLLSVSDKNCSADSSLTVKVYPQAIATFEMPATELCAPYEVVVKNTSNNPAGTTYTWQWGDGSSTTSDAAELTHTYSNGSYTSSLYKTISLTALTPDGCSTTTQQQLTINPQVMADFVTDKSEGCAPLIVYFTNRSQGNSSNASGWYIRKQGDTDFTAQGPNLLSYQFENTTNATLVYEVRYVAQSSGGCSDTLSREITVYPQVQPDISQNLTTGCAPLEVNFTNNNPKAREIYIWDWRDGSERDTTRYQQTAISHTFTNTSSSSPRSYMVQVEVRDTVSGCSSYISKEVSVLPVVRAEVIPNKTEGCAPLQVYFQNNSQGATHHRWEVRVQGRATVLYQEENAIPTLPVLENTGTAPKVYEVTYTARNNSTSCQDEQVTEITVHPGAGALFSMDQNTVCTDTEVTFNNLDIKAGIQYIWSWNDGEANDTTTTETTIRHTFINTSTSRSKQFEVKLTAYNPASGCSAEYRQTVWVNPAVLLRVDPDVKKGCAPLTVNFNNQSQNVSTHRWYARRAGSAEKLQEQDGAEASFVLENNTGNVIEYEVVYVASASSGCADSTVTPIEVYPELMPAFTTDSIRVRLPNSTFQIFNETPHAAAWRYHWDFGDGTSSNAVHPGSHTYGTYGQYTISMTISNGLCSETYTQEVFVNEILPIVDFESIPVSGCWPLTVNFKNNSQFADPNTYRWDFGDGEGYSAGENPTYTYYKPGDYTVTLSASNPSGEVVSTSYAIVNVYGRPKVDFEVRESVVYVPGDPVYVANYTIGGSTYLWDFGDGTTYEEFEPVHYYQEPGIYTISLISVNEWGCADTLVREEVVTAEAGGKVKIPNAFTPSAGGANGGNIEAGNNDVFYPVLDGGILKYNLRIYNRWGELLFESNDRKTGWDGYYKGQLCKADVYVYKVRVEFSDGKILDKIGDVTLIR
ncbi:PKD domain-containing protein [Nafulsella turpanensis]|uniref:PKD domain-containing protein n=1 Tax=Nafulsella turpanensis TaxID=1265690 RepID=UPI0009DA7863|nr:PKD domain-containing protein [Nafulsella turpanensis]